MDTNAWTPWVQRQWAFDEPVGLFPQIADRLRGAPARAEEKLSGLSAAITTNRPDGEWSMQEHLGHLLELEVLPNTRIEELLAGVEVLTAADMTNRATEEANFNGRTAAEIAQAFRTERMALVARLEALAPEDFARSALHPRLGTPMRLVDLLRFTADHDDHHLARMEALRA